jgi:gluconate 2-dehydrogenase subunit 3-like protein
LRRDRIPGYTERSVIARRSFLKRVLAALAVLLLGAIWIGRWSSRVHKRPRRHLRFLSPKEFSVLTAVAETMLPRWPDAPGFASLETIERIDESLAQLPAYRTQDVPGLLWAIEHLPSVTTGAFGTFTALPDADRTAVLRAWETSDRARLRTAYASLKYLVMLHYYADRRAWGSFGYVPVRLPQWDAAPGAPT